MAGDNCVFPFYYNGTQHYECIEYKDSDTGMKWCAVEVTEEGVEDFKWDYCPGNYVLTVQCLYTLCLGDVKTMGGGNCVFPFYLYGTEYYECTDDDGDIAKWCATTEPLSDDLGDYYWDYCAQAC